MHVLPALSRAIGVNKVCSVVVIGIARLNTWETYFAPSTGLIKLEDMEAQAIRLADRTAHAAAMSLSPDVASRHFACHGWRGLPGALRGCGCESLFVHASDVPPWRRPGLRRSLAKVGASLVVVDAESTRGEGS